MVLSGSPKEDVEGKMKTSAINLVKLLEKTKEVLLIEGNDFSWSSWNDSKEAVAEIDDLISKLKAEQTVELLDIEVLFSPTGPIQEVSLSSGWGQAFITLANQADVVIEDYKNHFISK